MSLSKYTYHCQALLLSLNTHKFSKFYGFVSMLFISSVLMTNNVSARQDTVSATDHQTTRDQVKSETSNSFIITQLSHTGIILQPGTAIANTFMNRKINDWALTKIRINRSNLLFSSLKTIRDGELRYRTQNTLDTTRANDITQNSLPSKWGPYESQRQDNRLSQKVAIASQTKIQGDKVKVQLAKKNTNEKVLTNSDKSRQKNNATLNQSHSKIIRLAKAETALFRQSNSNKNTRYPTQVSSAQYEDLKTVDTITFDNENGEKVTVFPLLVKDWYGVTVSMVW